MHSRISLSLGLLLFVHSTGSATAGSAWTRDEFTLPTYKMDDWFHEQVWWNRHDGRLEASHFEVPPSLRYLQKQHIMAADLAIQDSYLFVLSAQVYPDPDEYSALLARPGLSGGLYVYEYKQDGQWHFVVANNDVGFSPAPMELDVCLDSSGSQPQVYNVIVATDHYGVTRYDFDASARRLTFISTHEGTLTSDGNEHHGVDVHDGYAYVAVYKSGMNIYDIEDLAQGPIGKTGKLPDEGSGLPNLCEAIDVINVGARVYAFAVETDDEAHHDPGPFLRVFDVTDRTSPTLQKSLDLTSSAYDVTLDRTGTRLYVANGYEGLRLIDVTQPASPQILSTFRTPYRITGVTADGDTVFAACGSDGLLEINVSNPLHPQLVSGFDTAGYFGQPWVYWIADRRFVAAAAAEGGIVVLQPRSADGVRELVTDSKPMNDQSNGRPITSVLLTDFHIAEAGTTVKYQVRADERAAWQPVEPGVPFAFASAEQGTRLAWRANLVGVGTTNVIWPFIEWIQLRYEWSETPQPPGKWTFDAGPAGWRYYYHQDASGDLLLWSVHSGCADGFVYAPLGELNPWPDAGGGAPSYYFPFLTRRNVSPIRFDVPAYLSACMNVKPIPENGAVPAADLGEGTLHLFVGEWNTQADYSYYYYLPPVTLPAALSWRDVGFLMEPDAEHWIRLAQAGQGIPVSAILPDPDEWGFVIVGASRQLTGYLGLDELSVNVSLAILSVQRSGDDVVVTFGSSDPNAEPVLHQAEEIVGPWTAMQGATSPLTVRPRVPGAPRRGFWKLVGVGDK